MEFYVEQVEFKNKLDSVKKAVPTRTALPILECVYIKADKDIKIIASSLAFEISDIIEGNITEEGEFAVNAKLLSALISKLDNDTIKVATQGTNCVITCGKKKYELPAIFDAFPFIKKDDFSEPVVIDNFARRIHNVAYSAASDEQNATMTGVCIKGGKIIALDSHRVAINDFADVGRELIIPAKFLKTLTMDKVDFSYDDSFVKIVDGTNTIYIKLLSGKYFAVEKIVDSVNPSTFITIDKETFIDNLQTLSLFIKEMDRKPVILDIKDGSMKLTVSTSVGAGEENMDIEKSGNDLTIAFNPKFMIEALSHVDDEMVTIDMNGAKNPAIIKGDGYLHLLLPVSVMG